MPCPEPRGAPNSDIDCVFGIPGAVIANKSVAGPITEIVSAAGHHRSCRLHVWGVGGLCVGLIIGALKNGGGIYFRGAQLNHLDIGQFRPDRC
jgi:hypothetical protein